MDKGKCRYCGEEACYSEFFRGFVCWECHNKLGEELNKAFTSDKFKESDGAVFR